MINIGLLEILKIKNGSSDVKKIYIGTSLVWENPSMEQNP